MLVAVLYGNLDHHAEALSLAERTLTDSERVCGPDDPATESMRTFVTKLRKPAEET
ncbi:tetratricopeptide repeat protein [Streptomyces bambusae]|nr:tetratricopeptide repeat protein [Streptomyces bambusae]